MEYLSGVSGLVALVCFIMILIKMFQNGYTTLGIVCIPFACCGVGQIIALVFGWMKAKDWNITTLMIVYTIAFLITVGLSIAFPAPLPNFEQPVAP